LLAKALEVTDLCLARTEALLGAVVLLAQEDVYDGLTCAAQAGEGQSISLRPTIEALAQRASDCGLDAGQVIDREALRLRVHWRDCSNQDH
jgi:hypothetical protein